ERRTPGPRVSRAVFPAAARAVSWLPRRAKASPGARRESPSTDMLNRRRVTLSARMESKQAIFEPLATSRYISISWIQRTHQREPSGLVRVAGLAGASPSISRVRERTGQGLLCFLPEEKEPCRDYRSSRSS